MESSRTVLDGIRYDQLDSLLIAAVGLLYYSFSRCSRPCLRFVNNPMQPFFFIMTTPPCPSFVRCAANQDESFRDCVLRAASVVFTSTEHCINVR